MVVWEFWTVKEIENEKVRVKIMKDKQGKIWYFIKNKELGGETMLPKEDFLKVLEELKKQGEL